MIVIISLQISLAVYILEQEIYVVAHSMKNKSNFISLLSSTYIENSNTRLNQ